MHQYSHYRYPRRRIERGPKKILEDIIAENIPIMEKEIFNHIQEAHKVPGRRNTLRHIVIKLTKIKDKEKILKATRGKQPIT